MKALVSGLALTLILALTSSPAMSTADVGDLAPDFSLENVLDFPPDVFTLSDVRGSVVVIVFWAHW